ncbi:hypothetical protein ACEWY4_011428 [Coilia grayii]|uniref:PB1 domain-containing protein n=1 Tax=Coilia grayii TaxID=363190 RepID=A0ABD1K4Q8_9TELE
MPAHNTFGVNQAVALWSPRVTCRTESVGESRRKRGYCLAPPQQCGDQRAGERRASRIIVSRRIPAFLPSPSFALESRARNALWEYTANMSRNQRTPLKNTDNLVEVKSKFEAEYRRFALKRTNNGGFEEFYKLLQTIHRIPGVDVLLGYADIHGDLLPINNDDNFHKAVTSANPLLRIIIQKREPLVLMKSLPAFLKYASLYCLKQEPQRCLVKAERKTEGKSSGPDRLVLLSGVVYGAAGSRAVSGAAI